MNSYEYRHTEQLDRLFGDFPNKIVLFMLDYFNKPAIELKTPIEEWAYVLKDVALKSGVIMIPENKKKC